jgi:hypothetical protein
MRGPAHHGRGGERSKARDDPDSENEREYDRHGHAGNLSHEELDSGTEKNCGGLKASQQIIREKRARKKEGLPLGIGSPKDRVPVIRLRRSRIMGSSILASLSEAGGNDPYHPLSGPLPPHLKNDVDRVGTRPMPYPLQVQCPTLQQSPDSAATHLERLNDRATSLSAPAAASRVQFGNHNPALMRGRR